MPRGVARGGEHDRRRVLVVDDDDDSAAFLALLLEHDGHAVRVAGSGAQALSQVRAFAPELVLLDLRLGDMSGYELAAALRAGGAAGLLVALSGLEGDEVRERCRAAGIAAHLVKPIRDFEGFRRLVRSLVVHEGIALG